MGRMGRVPLGGAVLLAISLGLTGCGAFFSCEGKASCPTGGGGGTTGTGDYAYVSNSSLGSSYLNGYALSSGTLVTATGFPFNLGYVPEAMAITPSNSYLYVASDSATGAIYGYSIGTGGALTALDSGTALVSENVASIDISPDGKWLFALDADGSTMNEYSITTSTGALKYGAPYVIDGDSTGPINPRQVKFAPSGDFLVCALGTGGAEVFSFDTSTGVAAKTTLISTGSASVGINAVDVDGSGYIYASGNAGLQVFSTNSSDVATLVSTTPYTTGAGPNSLVIDTGNKYVYTGNETDGTLSGFTIGTDGALTAQTSVGSPYTGPTGVSELGRDNSGSFLLAAGYSATSGFQVFKIGSAGGLTVTNTAASGTDTTVPIVMALTH